MQLLRLGLVPAHLGMFIKRCDDRRSCLCVMCGHLSPSSFVLLIDCRPCVGGQGDRACWCLPERARTAAPAKRWNLFCALSKLKIIHDSFWATSTLQGFIEYKNFELGVLFHSGQQQMTSHHPRVAGGVGAGRYVQYKAYNRTCALHTHPVLGPPCSEGSGALDITRSGSQGHTCTSPEGGDAVVVLPVPYDMLGSDPFCDHKTFLKEPYFHDKSEVSRPSLLSCHFLT